MRTGAPADEDGLAMLVARLGPEALACIEMMSGAAWVRERLQAAGWTVQIADARKAEPIGSLAAKTGKLDARVLAELGVPQVWRRSIFEAVGIVRDLDERLIPIEQELRPLARADPRVALLVTIPRDRRLAG